jgi:hypothetical protein
MYGIKLIVFHSIYYSLLESSARRNGVRDARLFLALAPVHAPRVLDLFLVAQRKRKTVPQDILGIALCTCLSSCPFPSNCRELYSFQTRRFSRWGHRNMSAI